MTFVTTAPVRNDPVDPATRSFAEIMRLLDRLPQSFPFRGTIIGAVPKPVTKVGPLELDPVSPMNFGFQWGVEPVFDLKSIGPPVEFKVGGDVNARYVLKLIDKPGSTGAATGLVRAGRFQGHDRLDEPGCTVATGNRPQGVVPGRHRRSLLEVSFAAPTRLPRVIPRARLPRGGRPNALRPSQGEAYRRAGIYAGRILRDVPQRQLTLLALECADVAPYRTT